MKRATYLLTFILCQLAVVSASADDISLTEARSMASQYVTMPSVQKSKVNRAAAATGKFMNDFYCFNDASGNGFVLIADDDCVQPILGYSDSGTFDVDNVPVQLQDWLTAVSRYISQNKEAGKTVAARKVKGTPVVAPLVTTKWDQQKPFNGMTPIPGAYTGCVATAMAQIVNYYKWPAQGMGSHTYTSNCRDDSAHATYSSKEITVDFSQSVYDYANMLDEYKVTKDGYLWNDAQAAAVSKLMSNCGVAANMNYGVTRSGATYQDAAFGLCEYFSYNAKSYDHFSTSTPDFLKVITDELNGGFPVIFSGISDAGGHTFVVDGYDSNGFLHTNLGWSGQSNGYYDICDMDNFVYNQTVIAVHPNKTGVKSSYVYAAEIWKYHTDIFHHGGKDIINEPIDAFSVTLDSIFIPSGNDYKGYQALALYKDKHLVKLLDTIPISLSKMITLGRNEHYAFIDSLTLNVPKASIDTLSDGMYTLLPVNVGEKQMQSGSPISEADVTASFQLTFRTLSMEISNGKMTVCCVHPSDSINLKCEFARDTTYRTGLYDKLSIPVKIQNNGEAQEPTFLATLTKTDTCVCDTIFNSHYPLYDNHTRVFEANKQITSKSQVGKYVYALGYYDKKGTYVPIITPADSVLVEIYADSTCEKPTLTATLDYITDYNTGKMLDVYNLRTGGEGDPSTYLVYYKVHYTGKANIPYMLKLTILNKDVGSLELKYNLSDSVFRFTIPVIYYYQGLKKLGYSTTFTMFLLYKLPDDTEWQPLDKDRPYLVINPVSSGISSAQSAVSTVDASSPYYTLQGVKVQQPAAKGIYIRKGKKTIIR